MIKFNTNKEKTLTFDITVEGINPDQLTYTLRLSEKGIDYGFQGKMKNGEVVVVVPPLNSIMNQKRIDELTKVKLEIHDSENKYYMKPYEDTILIEKEPTLELSIKEEDDTIKESIVAIVKDYTDIITEKKTKKDKDEIGRASCRERV